LLLTELAARDSSPAHFSPLSSLRSPSHHSFIPLPVPSLPSPPLHSFIPLSPSPLTLLLLLTPSSLSLFRCSLLHLLPRFLVPLPRSPLLSLSISLAAVAQTGVDACMTPVCSALVRAAPQSSTLPAAACTKGGLQRKENIQGNSLLMLIANGIFDVKRLLKSVWGGLCENSRYKICHGSKVRLRTTRRGKLEHHTQ